MDATKLKLLVESGRQIGARMSLKMDDEPYYETAAIQKWNEKYRVSVMRIAESKMDSDDYEIDEVVELSCLDEAIQYLSDHSSVPFESMKTLKGQKLFDPEYLYSQRRSEETAR